MGVPVLGEKTETIVRGSPAGRPWWGERPTDWRCILFLLVTLFSSVPARAQSDYEGKTVTAIEFVGSVSANPDSVRAKIKTRVGDPLSLEKLNEDIKTMVEGLKLFSTIEQRLSPSGDGVKVSFFVSENPVIDTIIFLGIIELDREELEQIIESREGGLANDITLALDVQRIRERYLQDGYHFIQIGYTKEVAERTTVIFKVTEGPEVGVKEVDFNGNLSFEKDELLKAMPTTDENGFLSDHPYIESEFEQDIVNLQQFYRGHGFLDAEVAIENIEFSLDKEDVVLSVRITEGTPYTVRSITLEGLERFDAEELIGKMKTKVGGRYERAFRLNEDLRALERLYHDDAYINVRAIDASVVDPVTPEVDLKIVVREGARVSVGNVEIHGNIETRDKVIRRLLDDLVPGSPFNQNALERAKSRIINLRYFEANGVSVIKGDIPLPDFENYREVFVDVRDTDREDVKDIDIEVKEIDTGSVRFAVGVNSNAGLVGAVVYRKENFDPLDFPESLDDIFDAFTGGGQTLELSFFPGIQLTQYQLAYTHPFIFDSDFEFSLQAYKRFRIRENWDEERTGFSLGLGRRFGFNIAATVRYRLEQIIVDDIDTDASQIVFDFEGERLVSSLILGVNIADLDNYNSPGEGYRLNTTYEFAGLGGDINFHRINLDGEYYLTLDTDAQDRKQILFFIGRFGYVKEHSSSFDVPIYERLFAGGQNSIRGFEFRGVGPHTHNSPDGGKVLMTGSLNYVFPLYEKMLGGVLFVDAGTLAPEFSSPELGDIRVAVGFGVRVQIDFLGPVPFAIDFGFPLVKFDDDETQIISFSLDRRF
ncbi:MAG: outer membrane protein assembly factor BamA [Planctomycetes bacterium]|nr:outer membrane protein assembly factor BamA [Planctomycetota bacterium]